jgi:hypothetical protein
MNRVILYVALSLCSTFLLAACGDDTTSEGTTGDTASADGTSSDSASEMTDGSNTDPDTSVADTSGGGTPGDPYAAQVFANDPLTDGGKTTPVVLPAPTTTDGALANAVSDVKNCQRVRGEEIKFSGITVAYLCTEKATAFPNSFGNYLDHKPPADDLDPTDTFSEVQVYYHINVVHSFFKETFGVTEMDFALPSTTNMQAEITELAAGFLGVPPGWLSIDNAAYVPPNTSLADFGLAPRPEGTLMFLAGSLADLSYDASVIYHEYTHAVVGPNRLNSVVIDEQGIDNFPGAINEALADYFAVSQLDRPLEGPYLAKVSPTGPRDLSVKRTCPDHITTEIHADGKVIGSSLWRIREQLGAAVTDQLVYATLTASSAATSFEQFGQAMIAAAQTQLPAADADKVEATLQEYGVVGCMRAKPWVFFDAAASEEGVPYSVPGPQDLGSPSFSQWTPGIVQFYFDVDPGESIELTWSLGSGGGGLFGGSAPSPLDIAVRHDQPVQVVLTAPVSLDATAELSVPAPSGNSGDQVITLSGACLPQAAGRVYVMFLNRGAGSGLSSMGLRRLTDTAGAQNLVTCDVTP